MLRKALSPRPQSHICLSCQRRLRLARPINVYPYYAPKSFYSTDSNPDLDTESGSSPLPSPSPTILEEATSAATLNSSASTNDTKDNDTKDTNAEANLGVGVRRKLVPLLHKKPFDSPEPKYRAYKMLEESSGDVFGQRGEMQYKYSEPIDVKTFGEPSKILVLRQSKIKKYLWSENKHTQSEHIVEEVQPVGLDPYILDRIDAERGLPSLKEVEDNINHFKPDRNSSLNRKQFNNLMQEIQQSFTTAQLLDYIENHKAKVNAALDPASTNNPSSSSGPSGYEVAKILQIGPWVTDIYNTEEFFKSGSELHGYALASHTNKQRIVAQLLRECWKLALPDVENSIGSVEVEIHPSHLELLLKNDLIEIIKEEELLGRANHDIETFPSSGVIKITSTQPRYEPVINRIKSELNNIRTLAVPLSDLVPTGQNGRKPNNDQIQKWAAEQLDELALLEISRLTGTKIVRVPLSTPLAKRQVPISISCLLTPSDPWRFTRADQARRLLLSSCNPVSRTRHSLGWRPLPDNQTGSFVEYGLDTGLSWRDKLRKWSRFSAPVGKEIDDSQASREVVNFQDPEEHDSIDQAKAANDQPTAVPKAPPNSGTEGDMPPLGIDYWNDRYEVTSEAVLGVVLHTDPKSPGGLPKAPIGSPEILRAFSPTLPTVSTLIQNMKVGRQSTNDTLVLRFQPNPFFVDPVTNKSVGADVLSAFPAIEMVFDAVPTPGDDLGGSKDLILRAVDAVVEETFNDIMLPDQAVDVRFKQKTSSRLRARRRTMPEITEYLQFSTLRSGSGARRLDLPPTITMPIAKHLCKVSELAKLNRNPEDEIHQVEYLFVDREFRTALSLSYNDWKVSYTYINAGTDGRRNELTIKPIKSGPQANKQDYLNTVLELTESLGNPNFGGVRRVVMSEATENLVKFVNITEEKQGPLPQNFAYTAARPTSFTKYARERNGENASDDSKGRSTRENVESKAVGSEDAGAHSTKSSETVNYKAGKW